TPESAMVWAPLVKSSQVAGSFTPAWSKTWVLYQTVDLLAALKNTAYSFPLTEPSCFHVGPKLSSTVEPTTGVMSISDPCLASSDTRPGWGSMATSGGFLPAIRVPSTVAMSSPVEVKWTVAPVLAANPSSTAWKLACSSPVQTPATSSDCPRND